MNFIQAIILAIIEGITEYLPVSSTGHMILASSFMGIAKEDFVKLFTVAIQFGAILAVIVLYWKKFFKDLPFYYKLFVGFLPAVVFGLLFNDAIESLLENPVVVAVSLLLGGIVLVFIDDWFKARAVEEEVTYKKAFIIGFFQCIAMIPGVSRSASTIIGGMATGLTRKRAAEFSFFLAVPTMFAATAKTLFDYYAKDYLKTEGFNTSGLMDHLSTAITSHDMQLLLVGNVVAFVVSIIAIKSFVEFISKNGFKVFGYYRIILGSLLLITHFFIQKLDMI